MIAKRLDSRYTPGERRGHWLKTKHSHRQEFVIGGWADDKGGRSGRIGAPELGVYDDGELRYAGWVGTGFDDAELDRLADLLDPLRADTLSPARR